MKRTQDSVSTPQPLPMKDCVYLKNTLLFYFVIFFYSAFSFIKRRNLSNRKRNLFVPKRKTYNPASLNTILINSRTKTSLEKQPTRHSLQQRRLDLLLDNKSSRNKICLWFIDDVFENQDLNRIQIKRRDGLLPVLTSTFQRLLRGQLDIPKLDIATIIHPIPLNILLCNKRK